MDWNLVLEIAKWVLIVFLGGCSLLIKSKEKFVQSLINRIAGFIAQAEYEYKNVTKSGGLKHDYVVDHVYLLIPKALKPFISKAFIENLVDSVFEKVEDYANQQLDKLIDKTEIKVKVKTNMGRI